MKQVSCTLVMADGDKHFKSISEALRYVGVVHGYSHYYQNKYILLKDMAYLFTEDFPIDRSRITFQKKSQRGRKKVVYMLRPTMKGRKFESIKSATRYIQCADGTICHWLHEPVKKMHCGCWWFTEEQMIQGKKDGSIERMIKEYRYHEQSKKWMEEKLSNDIQCTESNSQFETAVQ